MRAGRPGRPSNGTAGLLAAASHDLRSSLSGMRNWTHVLETRLAGHPDPMVQRAVTGLYAAVEQQVRVIENLLEARAVESPLRSAAMTKRKDAQPDTPGDSARKGAKRPAPPEPKEAPGGRNAAKAERDARNKSTREGER